MPKNPNISPKTSPNTILNTNVDGIDRSSTSLHLDMGRFSTPWHRHEKRHQLLVSSSGVLHVSTRHSRLLLPARHGCFIPSGLEHRLESVSASLNLRTLYFSKLPGDPVEFKELKTFHLDKLGFELVAYSEKWQDEEPVSPLETKVIDLLRLLIVQWCKQPLPLSLPTTTHPRLGKIIDLIHNNLDQPLILEQIASQHGYSVRSLIRLFNRELGMNFGYYKRVARIIKATELLTEGNFSVAQVMNSVGYESASSFTRNFSDLLGVTPSEYLKAIRQELF